MTPTEYIEKAKVSHNNLYDYSMVKYIDIHTNIDIICKEHGVFTMRADHHLKDRYGCPICSDVKIRNYNSKKFIKDAMKLHEGKYSYEKTEYINAKTKVIIICPIHGEFYQTPDAHLHKQGCKECGKIVMTKNIKDMCMTKEKFIEGSAKKHFNKYDYSFVNFINTKTKVDIKCPIHGLFKQLPHNHLYSSKGCPECHQYSHYEIMISKLLILNNISFEYNKMFEDCRNDRTNHMYKFDFYIKDLNTVIEFDGQHHFIPIKWWGGEENLNEVKRRDAIKTKYCESKNIKLIRISYKDNIKHKLKENKIIQL